MSEFIAAKVGGTSNADADAVRLSMEWGEESSIIAVSAPGKLKAGGEGSDKVTDQLLNIRDAYENTGEIDYRGADLITQRYEQIVRGLGRGSLEVNWIDQIPARIEQAAIQGPQAASMLGERLMAEVYAGHGFHMIDPGRASHDLGTDRNAWREWLTTSGVYEEGGRHVLPGNTTKVNGELITFSRGGSDISGGLAAFGIMATLNRNLTDGCALSADPRLISPQDRLLPIEHLTYEEGRELGLNGTGLVHPAAMVPLMYGDIPTEVRSTFDRNGPVTLLDNDQDRAAQRAGSVMALSLMKDISLLYVHEPGMAEATGRLATFEKALAEAEVPLVDSRGHGFDWQTYIVNTKDVETARNCLANVNHGSTVEVSDNLSLITLVGHRLEDRFADLMIGVLLNSGINGKEWQGEGHDFTRGRHSLRISVNPDQAHRVHDHMHHYFIEDPRRDRVV